MIYTFIRGGGILNSLVFSVKSSTLRVADIIINLRRSFRFFLNGTILDNRPIKISVYIFRSWASSNRITEYFDSVKSYKQI